MSYKRLKFKIKPQFVILATVLIGAQLGLATPVLIDTFVTAQTNTPLTSSSTSHTASANLGSEVLGGFRIMDDVCTGCTVSRQVNFAAEGAPFKDLVLNTGNGVQGSGLSSYCGTASCGVATYSTGNVTPTLFGLGAVDLTSGGTNTQITIIGNTDLTVQIVARFYISSAIYAQITFPLLGTGSASTNIVGEFNFNGIGGTAPIVYFGGATANLFKTVNAITFEIEGTSASDTFINYFAADAPEPASFALFAGGLGCLLWYARKKATARI